LLKTELAIFQLYHHRSTKTKGKGGKKEEKERKNIGKNEKE
jgi:hypothetical protein